MNIGKNKNPENHQNKAEEPETLKKTIRIFNSFEEQEATEMKWLASQTSEQHLRHTVSLIKRIFTEELEEHSEIGKELFIK